MRQSQCWSTVGAAALFLVVCSNCSAADCSSVASAVGDARDAIRRVTREDDFNEARDLARKARNALDDAASAAEECKCDDAHNEFDDAATHARRARDASDSAEFVDEVRKMIRDFNSAVGALQACARTRRN